MTFTPILGASVAVGSQVETAVFFRCDDDPTLSFQQSFVHDGSKAQIVALVTRRIADTHSPRVLKQGDVLDVTPVATPIPDPPSGDDLLRAAFLADLRTLTRVSHAVALGLTIGLDLEKARAIVQAQIDQHPELASLIGGPF